MRRASYDKSNNAKRNILATNTSYGITSSNLKNVNQKYSSFQSYESLQEKNYLQRSISADNVIRSRGYKPSDRHDPVKRSFLENLTSKILHFDMESGERTPINLQKLLTPASDTHEPLQAKNKKMFASSYFYAPTHPTVEDQVELARRISLSLSDVKNMKSKGQSMYVNRKKRSVKWIHDGNGTEGEEEPSSPMHKDKVPLKCVMNPHGKVLDIHGIQALGEEVNIEPMPSHPEKLFDIVRDLNNQRGRGAEIFAKRRKRSEKWIVDQDQAQLPSTPGIQKTPGYSYQSEMNGNSKFSTLQSPFAQTDKSFYNPFAVDLSLDNINPPMTSRYHHHHRHHHRSCQLTNDCNHSTQIKKIYLREVAVGTDTDFPIEKTELNNDARRSNGFNGVRSSNANVERRSNKLLSSKTNANNTQIATNKETKTNSNREIKQRLSNNFSQDVLVNDRNKFRNKQQSVKREEDVARFSDSDASEYTPVPVKQLIQEFEKTCRPVLQYKQISPKVIPIVQQCPIDTDITRFFQTRTSVKYEEEVPEDDEEEDEEEEEEYIRRSNREIRQEKQINKPQPRIENGYMSTDETEYTSDSDSLRTYDFKDYKDYKNETSMYRYEKTSNRNVNGDGDYPGLLNDEYSQRRRSATSQELESYCNGNVKFVNEDSELPAQAKSLLLSMVASQDDILQTIKHLRNTPVLDNLLPGVSPELKFTDSYPEVGKEKKKTKHEETQINRASIMKIFKFQELCTKLYEDNTYKGPKLASIHNLTNYNTAPRGWDQSLTYYRPIKFEKSQDTIVYSDF
ncbi:hypothetical protein HZH66_015263 [Vespula vulgaris]|uniref:Uncharacterized protein n=1 Tax=Vespula vulgaris TaxID=7454 RepID=A0A834IYX8_VESVU|nr:hypothetical protein HZH66_015263 [Vespula vulgaris]